MFSLALLAAVLGAPSDPVTVPPQEKVLATLRAAHPRLIGLPEDLARVKKAIADDPRAADIYKKVKGDADRLLRRDDTVQHKLVGPRLLGESRKCVDRVYTLATVYRVEGDRRYAQRAVREMMAAAAFKDWNPSHFLDTAEMTHALAIGYDWLYDALSPEERKTVREAIVRKGLREAEKVYRGGGWWSKSRHNWNQVCNGGIAIGALAVAEDEPELAAWTVHQALGSVPLAMREFAPDGAWGEGPGYWNYATRYNVYMIAALESALGTDFGLSRFAGFAATGEFRMNVVAPTLEAFNFADGGPGAGTAAQMFWFARKFDKPLYAWHERDVVRGATPLHLWWYDPRGGPPGAELPTARHFRHADVVMMRTAWNDPNAVFAGFKAGDNKVNHSHLELGTFVMEADGQRWALDLGPDDYNLPGYFGRQRWTYYRLATEGQNTLWIDRANQDPKAVAPIVAFSATAARAHAVADLSDAYAKTARQVRRGIALIGRQVLVQDEIEGAEGREIAWQMHTRAKIEPDGARAVLRQGGRTLTATIVAPPEAVFSTAPASPPPPQAQQPDVTKLVVRLQGAKGPLRLAVVLAPGDAAEQARPAIKPLGEWPGAKGKVE